MLPAHEFRFMRLVNYDLGTSITGESANPNWARQGRYKVVFYDEFQSTEYAEEIWTGAGDSTPSRIVVGTPKGTGNKFWKLRYYEMPPEDQLHIHWTLHPRKIVGSYSKDGKVRSPWYDAEAARRTPAELAQEVDMDYLASGNPYFDLLKIDKQVRWKQGEKADTKLCTFELGELSRVSGKVKWRPTPNGRIRVFEHPGPITQAAMWADPAEGLEHGDMSCIAVRCKRTGNLLAGVYGKYPPDQLAEMEWLLSLYYNNGICTAEMGGYGLVINQFLWDKGANVFKDVDTTKGEDKQGKKLGFNSKRHRAEMLRLMEEETRMEACELRDPLLITECMNFINKDGKPQAAEGSCDDYVISFAGCGLLIDLNPYSKMMERIALQQGEESDPAPPPANQGFGFAKEGRPPRRF
jgi:hypothetical protein